MPYLPDKYSVDKYPDLFSVASIDYYFIYFFNTANYLYSAILRSLEQTHCARMWFYMSDWLFSIIFYSAFLEYPPVVYMQRRLGASSVYTIQPCSVSQRSKPHT